MPSLGASDETCRLSVCSAHWLRFDGHVRSARWLPRYLMTTRPQGRGLPANTRKPPKRPVLGFVLVDDPGCPPIPRRSAVNLDSVESVSVLMVPVRRERWLGAARVKISVTYHFGRLGRGRLFAFRRSETHQFRVRYVDAHSGVSVLATELSLRH